MDTTLSSKGSAGWTLQKKALESQKPIKTKQSPAPDLTDFMNDMFFGTVKGDDKKAYNLTGGGRVDDDDDDEDDDDDDDNSIRSNSSKLTQEWLEEAKRMMGSSPSRCDSPARLVGSPRFASNAPAARILALDKRDPLSRSARRHRAVEGFSEEILTKSAKHTRNRSATFDSLPASPTQPSPASQLQNWFSNILKPPLQCHFDSSTPTLPPRQSSTRRSRFQTDQPPSPASPQGIPLPSRRTFKPLPSPDSAHRDPHLLSPPKNLPDSFNRNSFSSFPSSQPLSPPRNLVQSTHRLSISKSTCSTEKLGPKINANGRHKEEGEDKDVSLNGYLKRQRIRIDKILNGEVDAKAKIVLSAPSNSTGSMVAAICYAWLLQNRLVKNKGEGEEVVVPVMNLRRQKMWKQRQASWLFHHVGLDASSLLFADEVDLENLMMSGKLNLLVVGQDVLVKSNEVGSQCTILTDNYCEDAYDLLQTPVLKKLLLAGILLDTRNLNASHKLSMTRDAEAVQLLLVGAAPNYRNLIFDQLMQDQRENSFFEALRFTYGRPPSESGRDTAAAMDQGTTGRKSTSVSRNEAVAPKSENNSSNARPKSGKAEAKQGPTQVPAAQEPSNNSRGKNKFFLAKWFGFGSK